MIAGIPPVRERERERESERKKKEREQAESRYGERTEEVNCMWSVFHKGAVRIVTTCVYDK